MKKCFAIRASEYAAMRIKNLENHQQFGVSYGGLLKNCRIQTL
jgi:hypothetical protein